MRKMKKLVSLLLVIGMLMAMWTFPAYASGRITVNAGKNVAVKPNEAGNYTLYGSLIAIGKETKTFTYNVNIPKKGAYHMYIDGKIGKDKRADITIGGKEFKVLNPEATRVETYVGRVELNEGNNSFVIMNTVGGTLEISNFIFEPAGERVATDFTRTSGAFKNHYIPTIIEAEDYDLGENGCYSMEVYKTDTAYRGSVSVPIIGKPDGRNIISLRATEWTNYSFIAPEEGSYNFSIRTEMAGNMEFYFDGSEYPINAKVSEGETTIANLYLEKGNHILKVKSVDAMVEVDYIAFTGAREKGAKPETLVTIPLTEEELEAQKSEVRPVWKELWISADAKDGGNGTKEAPFKSIMEAKEYIKTINNSMQGDIVVKILPGEYYIPEMIKFDESDGGKNGWRVIYQGSNTFEKPVVSGGTRISNWVQHEKGVWKASVPNIKDMRTLYINGFAGQRARSKYIYNFGDAYDDPATEYPMDGYKVSKLNLPVMSNVELVEICFNQLWTVQRAPINRIIDAETPTDAYVVCDQPHFNGIQTNYNNDITPLPGSKGYFENAYELIDEYGEFYFDPYKKMVYYYPFPQEDMKTSDIVAGTTEFFFQIYGSDKNSRVEGLHFDNIDFRYATWLDVSRTGISTFQADCLVDENYDANRVQGNGRTMPAVMQVRRARDISFTNCNFQNVGASAIYMDEHVEDSVVDGNVFRDLSGTAVTVGSWRTSGLEPSDLCEDIAVTNNVMHRIGLDYYGSPAIGIYYARRITADHNDIKDTPYTAITSGWGWGSEAPIRLDSSGQSIRHNRIVDNSNVVKDGGPIYTLGDQRNTYIQYNYLTDSRDFGGIYFDSGSAMITCTNNVLEDMQQSGIFGAGSLSYGMLIKDNWANNKNQKRSEFAAKESDCNVPIVCENGWPQEALDVIAKAGVGRGYKRLLTGIEYPSWRTEFWEFENAINQFYKSVNIIEQEATIWMEGGDGVAYRSANNKNGPKVYDLGLNMSIGNTSNGDWLKYEIDVKQDGEYMFELIYSYLSSSKDANVSSTAGINVYVDDVKVIDKVMLPSTGSWNAYLPTDVGIIPLTKGKRVIKVEFVNAWAFQKFRLIKTDFVETEPEFDDGIMLR